MDEVRECQAGEQMSMLMSLALDGMLERDDKHQLDRHLEACPSCRLEWKAMQQVSVLLEGEPMVGPPLGFAVRVERQLQEKTKKRRRASILWKSGSMIARPSVGCGSTSVTRASSLVR